MFDHLSPEARAVATESADYRKLYCQKEIWVPHPGASLAIERLTEYARHPKSRDMPVGLISGPTGTGRRTVMERLIALHPEQVKIVTLPETFQERRVAISILKALRHPSPWRCDVWRLIEITATALRNSDVRIVCIYNADDIGFGGRGAQGRYLALLRRFKEQGKVSLIFRGGEQARKLLGLDPELREQAEQFSLRPWGIERSTAVAIARAVREFPLRLPTLIDEAFLQVVFESSAGVAGRIFAQLRNAAWHAIDRKIEHITPELLRSSAVRPRLGRPTDGASDNDR